jgi:hypothetical protein
MPIDSAPILIHEVSILGPRSEPKRLEIWLGDVTARVGPTAADLLVISAFPDDYIPVPGTVVERLLQLGINVESEAASKAQDWRKAWNCWVSRPLGRPQVGQLICFEHGWDARPESVVGNVFRTVRELLSLGEPGAQAMRSVETLRMPLLSTGQQQASRREMLRALITQAFLHLAAGLPVKRVQLFLRPGSRGLESLLVELGVCLEENRHQWQGGLWNQAPPEQDLFMSYRHGDLNLVTPLLQSLKALHPGISIFIDHEHLVPGHHWKLELLKAMARCRRALCLITDTYPDSVECVDEFHAALLRSQHQGGFLLPVLNLRNRRLSDLPDSMRRVQGIPSGLPKESADALAQRLLPHLIPSPNPTGECSN